MGDPPLVIGQWHVCSSELIGLFLRGKAGGNVGAYTPDGVKQDWAEKEQGVPFELAHWNGLPPCGPRCVRLRITAPVGAAPPAPAQHKESY
eukprot:gene13149-32010_t